MLQTPGPTGPGFDRYFQNAPAGSFHGLQLVTPPTSEPVTLVDIKAQARIDLDVDDDLLTSYIAMAREYCESATNRCFRPQSWRLTLLRWPWRDYIELPIGPVLSLTSFAYTDTSGTTTAMVDGTNYSLDVAPRQARLVLPFSQVWPPVIMATASPINAVFRLGYPYCSATVTASGTTVTASAGDSFDSSLVNTATLIGGTTWAVVASVQSATVLTLTTSVTAAAGSSFVVDMVPARVKQAIKMLVAHYYENREPVVVGRGVVSVEVAMTVDALLGFEQVIRF